MFAFKKYIPSDACIILLLLLCCLSNTCRGPHGVRKIRIGQAVTTTFKIVIWEKIPNVQDSTQRGRDGSLDNVERLLLIDPHQSLCGIDGYGRGLRGSSLAIYVLPLWRHSEDNDLDF